MENLKIYCVTNREINSIDKERFEEIHQLNKTLSSLSFLIKESKTNVSINDEELKMTLMQ